MKVGHQGDYGIDVRHKAELWRRNKLANIMATQILYLPTSSIVLSLGDGG